MMEETLDSMLEPTTTKEKIIMVAIEEFADKGYEKASMRKIAEKVGIKASSIYNHFKSKEEILEEVFKYYQQAFYGSNDLLELEIDRLTKDQIPTMFKQSLEGFIEVIKQPEMNNILKIIMNEQFQNNQIRTFFLEAFIEEPKVAMRKIMQKLMDKGFVKEGDPHLFAQEFYGFPIYKIYGEIMLKDPDTINLDKIQQSINTHIDFLWASIKK